MMKIAAEKGVLSEPIAARRRRVLGPWRLAFVCYLLVLTIATHWPNLSLGPEVPASDKMIHLCAFGTLALLLWLTRWIRSAVVLALLAVVWATIDETSQGLPHLNRTVSGWDLLANAMGIGAVTLWVVALGPVGIAGGTNRRRLRSMWFEFEELFARPGPWIAAAIIAAIAGAPLLVIWKLQLSADAIRLAITIAMAGASLLAMSAWTWQWQQRMKQSMRERPCLACAAPTPEGANAGTCQTCGSALDPQIWRVPAVPPKFMLAGIGFKPVVIGAAIICSCILVIRLTPALYGHFMLGSGQSQQMTWRLGHMLGAVPPELNNAVDLFASSCVLALVVGLYRRALARAYDRAERCFFCGHDLRGTPSVRGIGHCGECGADFQRPAHDHHERGTP
jgi:hypothetical protein